jgi:Tfp pilus assembly protein PilF
MARLLLISVFATALLSGCGSVMEATKPAGEAAPEGEAMIAEIAARNPYLDTHRRVNSEAQQRFAAATAAMAVEDWGTAQVDLQWLIENHPKLSGPYLNLALLHSAKGEHEGAETFFQSAIEVNPRNLGAYNQYAIFLREQGRFDDAEHVYLEALAAWEDHAETHRNLGVLYDLYRGEHEKALQHYHRYQALTGNEDRTVAGWIIVLERQFSQVVQRGDE